jgi:outer membrane biosynthesis protein TonB
VTTASELNRRTAPRKDAAAAPLTDHELRVLSHYAAGTELKHIATMTSADVEDIRQVIHQRAGFERPRAGELVRAHHARQKKPAAVKKAAPPAVPGRFVEPPPPAPEPEVKVELRADAQLPQPEPAPEPTREPRPDPEPEPPAELVTEPTSIEAILTRADVAGGLLASYGRRIREMVAKLDHDLARSVDILAAEQRVREARQQYEAANAALRALRYGDVPSDTLLRRWANANDVTCPKVGYVGKQVIQAWKDKGSPDLSGYVEVAG